jgi:hypothetical protein
MRTGANASGVNTYLGAPDPNLIWSQTWCPPTFLFENAREDLIEIASFQKTSLSAAAKILVQM